MKFVSFFIISLGAILSYVNAGCEAENVFNECIQRQNAMMSARCVKDDYGCQCYWFNQIATCYNLCDSDLSKAANYQLVIQQQNQACSIQDSMKKAIEAAAEKSSPSIPSSPSPSSPPQKSSSKNYSSPVPSSNSYSSSSSKSIFYNSPQSTETPNDYKINTSDQIEGGKNGNNISLKIAGEPIFTSSSSDSNPSPNQKAESDAKSSGSWKISNNAYFTLSVVLSKCDQETLFNTCLQNVNTKKATTCLGKTDYACLCSWSKKALQCYEICPNDPEKENFRNSAEDQADKDCLQVEKYNALKSKYLSDYSEDAFSSAPVNSSDSFSSSMIESPSALIFSIC
ncbi:hypothetical protein AYI68_g4082 [Smittium mucronatum]|uniref:Extracellular membrane protein CFEM domain-containing protein n=1 Tax=Smittium mucronatum TaxID=133383 RepID=A0A1R0GY89_9FUNG|nr:hypothetical protein AYI68_g4082 [Smittium mucronatum]